MIEKRSVYRKFVTVFNVDELKETWTQIVAILLGEMFSLFTQLLVKMKYQKQRGESILL